MIHNRLEVGVYRLAMLILGMNNIRDCIAFPKTQRTVDLMTGAPTPVSDKQLEELHVRVVQPEKKEK